MEQSQEHSVLEQKPKKKKWWILFLVLFILLLAFLIFGFIQGRSNQSSESKRSSKNCQNNPNPVFTADFTDLDKIRLLAPIGSINAGSPGRAYVFIPGNPNVPHEKVPLYAPIDATLEGIVYARRVQNDPSARGEYRLDFRISCEVTFSFDHIAYPTDEIKALAPAEPLGNTGTVTPVNIPVKAGQLLGSTDGALRNGSWDFYLINKSKEVPHINPIRWIWEQTKYADCPYDYYPKDLKAKYYNKLRSVDGLELNPVSCGSPSHDIAGTASGGWFQGDSNTMQGLWMEIGNATEKTEINIREKGMSFFSIRDYKTSPLPDKLTVGNSACYKGENKWAYVRVDSDSKLSLAKGEGTCPSSFPNGSAETWER